MDFHDLLDLFFSRSDALEGLWTIYITVIGALLGFCATRDRLGLWTMWIISLGFVLFAAANLSAMYDISVQRYALLNAIKEAAALGPTDERAVRQSLTAALSPAPFFGWKGILSFHVCWSMLTLAALWIISYRKGKAPNRNA